MTHVTRAVVAEHAEGLLPADEAARVTAHLRDCDRCTALADELDAVSAVLAQQGARVPPIPDLVARRVRGAIEEEAAGLAGRPATESVEVGGRARPDARRWPRALLAAAAVVVVGLAGAEVVDDVGLGTGAEDAAGVAGDAAELESGAGAGGGEDAADEQETAPTDGRARPGFRSGPDSSLREFLRRMKREGSVPERVTRHRADCVGQALGDARWRGYSYRFERSGRRDDVVAVQPSGDLYRVSIIRCGADPRVLVSGRLPDPA